MMREVTDLIKIMIMHIMEHPYIKEWEPSNFTNSF